MQIRELSKNKHRDNIFICWISGQWNGRCLIKIPNLKNAITMWRQAMKKKCFDKKLLELHSLLKGKNK